MSKYTVGQSLWFHTDQRHSISRAVTVTKVGRKWVGIGRHNERFDIDTGIVESNGFTIGRIYLTQQDCEHHLRTVAAWRKMFGYMAMPRDMTLERIQKACEILGVPTP